MAMADSDVTAGDTGAAWGTTVSTTADGVADEKIEGISSGLPLDN